MHLSFLAKTGTPKYWVGVKQQLNIPNSSAGTRYIDGSQYIPNNVNSVYYDGSPLACFYMWWYLTLAPFIALFDPCGNANRFVCQYYSAPTGVHIASYELTQQNQAAKWVELGLNQWVVCSTPPALSPDALSPRTLGPCAHSPRALSPYGREINWKIWHHRWNFLMGVYQKQYLFLTSFTKETGLDPELFIREYIFT